jgi:hypothetical protein
MKRKWIFFKILKVIAIVLIAGSLFTLLLMSIWNAVIPDIFHGAPIITFWQALGLLVLSRILFGGRWGKPGWARHHHGDGPPWKGHWRQHLHNKWTNMTPEERDKWREHIKRRCGKWGMNLEEEMARFEKERDASASSETQSS